jgi:DNA-binding IclR family transcriptional regulator
MGALTVSIPIVRYTSEVRARAIAEVTQAARALSMQLGGR